MNTSPYVDTCFQCGKPRIETNKSSELINGSMVVSTESICSDPECQKQTTDNLEVERKRRLDGISSKSRHRGFRAKTKH